jgi:hypothetical protein
MVLFMIYLERGYWIHLAGLKLLFSPCQITEHVTVRHQYCHDIYRIAKVCAAETRPTKGTTSIVLPMMAHTPDTRG